MIFLCVIWSHNQLVRRTHGGFSMHSVGVENKNGAEGMQV
jgi:hypothetical protein